MQWDIPGGNLKIGEDPVVGLKREIKEEVGLDILVFEHWLSSILQEKMVRS